MSFQKLLSFVLGSSALLGVAGATSAQGPATAGTTVKVPADQIAKEECVIFLVSDGKFDAQTLEKE